MIPKELFKQIRRLEIRTKGLVDSFFGGEYHSAFKGRGMAFSEVRPYQIGDDVRTIDWNVSARTGETYIKVFEEEREQTLLLVVDVSGSEDFGSQGRLKREVAAEVCALIAFSAIRNGDKVGLLLVSDRVELFVSPGKGRTHVLRIIRDLYAHERKSVGTDLNAGFAYALRILPRRAIVLVVSDFLAEGYDLTLRALARRHDVVGIHLQDAREEALPSIGLLYLTDAETGETVIVDTRSSAARQRFIQTAQARFDKTVALLKRSGVDRVDVRTDEGYLDGLVRFFQERNKRRGR